MRKTLSIPDEMQKFFDENPDLSPSKMLQAKIIEIQDNRKHFSDEFQKQEMIIKKMNNLIKKFSSFIDQKGLMEEWGEYDL